MTNRLQAELHRLFHLPRAPGGPGTDTAAEATGPIEADGWLRAMVLQVARPADWDALSIVWRGVQADLALPAPAIAVSGTDGYQLWFSLAEPVPTAQATAFLESLRERYLGDVAAKRVSVLPASGVPSLQAQSGHWSAFVAPDLAPVFADEPWLDTPPSADGQADLLARLASIGPADFQATLARLRPAMRPPASPPPPVKADARPGLSGTPPDPTRFLLDVMNDPGVALGLRIEAAKALLPWFPPAPAPSPPAADD